MWLKCVILKKYFLKLTLLFSPFYFLFCCQGDPFKIDSSVITGILKGNSQYQCRRENRQLQYKIIARYTGLWINWSKSNLLILIEHLCFIPVILLLLKIYTSLKITFYPDKLIDVRLQRECNTTLKKTMCYKKEKWNFLSIFFQSIILLIINQYMEFKSVCKTFF